MRRFLPAVAFIFAILLYGADFWKTKDPAQWSDEEVSRMLAKSPWARAVSLQTPMAMQGGGGAGGMGGETGVGETGGGGGRGGGRGGMADGIPLGATMPPITVRWESAAPVRAARERQKFAHMAEIVGWSKENYVASLTGFQPGGGRRSGVPEGSRSQRGEAQGESRGGAQRSGTNPNSDVSNFRGAAIRHDNKQTYQLDRTMIIRTEQGPELYLLFSRKNAIASTTKEIIIDFAIGTGKVQAKFKVKDLEYRGKLDL